MRRLLLILFHCVTAISLLLCVATALLWVRSESVEDVFVWPTPPYRAYGCINCLGVLSANYSAQGAPLPPGVKFDHSSRNMDPQLAAGFRRWIARNTWHGFAYAHVDTSARGGADSRRWWVPHWFIVLITAALPAAAIYHRFRRRARQGSGRCAVCGYDLRATPARCPECGAVPAPTPSPLRKTTRHKLAMFFLMGPFDSPKSLGFGRLRGHGRGLVSGSGQAGLVMSSSALVFNSGGQ